MNEMWAIFRPDGTPVSALLERGEEDAWRYFWNRQIDMSFPFPQFREFVGLREADGYRAVRLIDADSLRAKVEGCL